MGYFKNQLIAEQVEVGDRVPAPKPASSHISLEGALGRRAMREARRHNGLRWRFVWKRTLLAYQVGLVLLALIAIVGWLR